jgi:hypothetical protein
MEFHLIQVKESSYNNDAAKVALKVEFKARLKHYRRDLEWLVWSLRLLKV